MTADLAAGLRALAEALPSGTAIPIPREALLELLGGENGRSTSETLPQERTQREAAALLRVSVSYLRASSCPKHFLPGNGPRGRALVPYRRDEILAWGAARTLAPRIRRA